MPPKKPTSPSTTQSQQSAASAELAALAAQARLDATLSSRLSRAAAILSSVLLPSVTLLTLAAVSSAASAWALTPVYGSIPAVAGPGHAVVVFVALFVGWAGNVRLVGWWQTWLTRSGNARPVKGRRKGKERAKATAAAVEKETARQDGDVAARTEEDQPPLQPAHLLPLLALYMPVLQHHLFSLSTYLTAGYGPGVTEAITLFPLLALSVATIATTLESLDAKSLLAWTRLPASSVRDAFPGLAAFAYFKTIEGLALDGLVGRGHWVGALGGLVTRIPLQVALAGCYLVYVLVSTRASGGGFPRRVFLRWAIPALLHVALWNPHVSVPGAGGAWWAAWSERQANRALARATNTTGTGAITGAPAADGPVVLLARRESNTGYVSVVENEGAGWRALRCDHSLLGGEWVRLPGRSAEAAAMARVPEPIYAVFVMLEAVRLVEVEGKRRDDEAQALVIGLGAGTAPAALSMHGINTTVVEIDAAVVDFANRYFQLPSNLTTVVVDAVDYARRTAADPEGPRFDYLVHDVFTGGAEPIPLFTLDFIRNLYDLLTPNGVVAINYAGDLLLPSTGLVVRTILSVFPSCRVFRELEREDNAVRAESRDFTNMVVFCTKRAEAPVVFREVVEEDLLGTVSRKMHLLPRHEVPLESFKTDAEGKEETSILATPEDVEKLAKYHLGSALGHWRVMRTVLPAKVWELW